MARRKRRGSEASLNLEDPAVQEQVLSMLGMERPKPKANVLQRLTSALGAFETGNAVYTAMESGDVTDFFGQYAKDIVGGLSGAVTGNVQKEKKTYSDVLEKAGVKNKLIKGALGFVGDVALDPSTYVGVGAAGKAGKVGGKSLTRTGREVFERSTIKFEEEIAKKGLKEFAEREGLAVADKTAKELAQEAAENRLFKYATTTGQKVFEEPTLRFAGKKVASLGKTSEALAKSYFDPISSVASFAGKAGLNKVGGKVVGNEAIQKTVNSSMAQILFPVRRLFSRTAELAGDANVENEYKTLIREIILPIKNNMTGSNPRIAREAEQFYETLVENVDHPEAFLHVFEGASDELLNKLDLDTATKVGKLRELLGVKQGFIKSGDMTKVVDEIKQTKDNLLKIADRDEDFYTKLDNLEKAEKVARTLDTEVERSIQGTKALIDAGVLEDRDLIAYTGRRVIKTPEGKLVNVKDTDAFKKRTYDTTAGFEAAGGVAKTTGKTGKEAAASIADQFARDKAITAKALAWKDLETQAKGFLDSSGAKQLFQEADLSPEVLKSGVFKQVKSPITGKPLFGGAYMHQDLAQLFQNTHKMFFGDPGTNGLLKIYDKVNNLWKSSVTKYFPAFHIRNMMSNVFTNTMAGVKDPGVYKQAVDIQKYSQLLGREGLDSEAVKKAGSKIVGRTGMNLKDILDIAERQGVIKPNTFYDELAENAKFLKGKSKLGKVSGVFTGVGNFAEDNARLAHFVDRLNKGYSIKEAAFSTKKYLFDYGDLTQFEKNIMRRIMPFYTWTRKNFELQLRQIASEPGKYGAMLKGFRDLSDAFSDLDESEMENLPGWVRAGVHVAQGRDGTARVVLGFGTPIEAFSDFVGQATGMEDQSVISSFSPTLKAFIEGSFDQELFTGKKISENTNGVKYKDLPQFVKDMIGYREVERETSQGKKYTEYIVDPNTNYKLNLVMGRLVSTASSAGRLLNGEEWELLNLLSGIKMKDFNLTEEEEKRLRERQQAFFDLLVSEGIAKEYTTQYVPADTKTQLAQSLSL